MTHHQCVISRRNGTISIDIGTKELIPGQELCAANVTHHQCVVSRRNSSVSVSIAFQMNLHILNNGAVTDHYGVLTGDVVLLHHLHGVGTGGNALDCVAGGVALDENLIVCLGVALGNQLKNDVIGIAAKAGGRAGNGISNNRDVLPNCGYGSVSSNGNLVANCLFTAANAPSLELLAIGSSKAVCRERVFAETPVAAAILPVSPFAAKETV